MITLTPKLCPVCKSKKTDLEKIKNNVPLFRCGECSLIFIPQSAYPYNPMQQYEDDETSPSDYYESTAPIDKKNFIRTLRALEKYIYLGTILDVGASIGTFLNIARNRGWRGIGIEPNPVAVKKARAKQLTVIQGFFTNDSIIQLQKQNNGQLFDAIHLGDVIEHVFDPISFLRLSYQLLKPGGYLVMVTPDIDTLLARKYQIKPKEHLIYFNKTSIQKALAASGFEKVIIKQQAKFRDIAKIGRGTVYLDPLSKVIYFIAKIPPIGWLLNIFLNLFSDELFVIARKPKQN